MTPLEEIEKRYLERIARLLDAVLWEAHDCGIDAAQKTRLYAALKQRLLSAARAEQWVRVSERPPEKDDDYLVRGSDRIGEFFRVARFSLECWIGPNITHWLSIPPLQDKQEVKR